MLTILALEMSGMIHYIMAENDFPLRQYLAQRFGQLVLLPRNWDGCGADPPSREVIAYALGYFDAVATNVRVLPSVVPTVDGGVQVEWHARGVDVEIRFSEDCTEIYVDGSPNPDSTPSSRLAHAMSLLS